MSSGNPSQKLAISIRPGPTLVIAGPGSGKTFVLCRRIHYLIYHLNINPSKILVITFSKAAAIQMQQKFTELMQGLVYPVTFGTFHSIFFQMIRNTLHYNASNILNKNQKRKYLKKLLQTTKLNEYIDNDFLDGMLSRISYYKNSGELRDNGEGGVISTEEFKELYHQYQFMIRNENMLDFDDMMLLCKELLKNNHTLSFYQNYFEYILIDEFQDINQIQYDIVKQLAYPQNNIFVVGDDDQAIYSFRGASPDIMKQLEKDYINVNRIILDTNYRSTKELVEAANLVIKENKNRYRKKVKAITEDSNSLRINSYTSKEEQYQEIINIVKREYQLGTLDSCACLFRTNLEAIALAQQLSKENIPFRMKEKPNLSIYHMIGQDLICYFRLADSENELYRNDFIVVMNKPTRYFSSAMIRKDRFCFQELISSYRNKAYMIPIIEKFKYDLMMLKRMDPYARVNYIRKVIGYDDYLKSRKSNHYIEILDEIQRKTKEFTSTKELETYLIELEEQFENKQNNGIQFMTFHASKGLEFEHVIIPDCNEGTIPNRQSTGEREIEEERRMFYVAMTRAKKKLTICYVTGTGKKAYMPSRFLYPILKRNPVYKRQD